MELVLTLLFIDMIPCDGFLKDLEGYDDDFVDMDKIITDKILNQMLVKKLTKGSRFFVSNYHPPSFLIKLTFVRIRPS